MSDRSASVAVFIAVAAVAVIGLAFSSYYSSGAVVSISPGPVFEEQTPHVIGASRPLRCLSDAYCPKDQSCVDKVCTDTAMAVAKGWIQAPSLTPEPSPDYAIYETGGVPAASAGSRDLDNPSYAHEDFSRSTRPSTYSK